MSSGAERQQQGCRCGHSRSIHEHYRRGTDCAAPECDCMRFTRSRARVGASPIGPEHPSPESALPAESRAPVRAGV